MPFIFNSESLLIGSAELVLRFIYLSPTVMVCGKNQERERLGGSVVEPLPLAQVVIPGSWDESHIGFPAGSLLLPLPVSLPLSVCLSRINKTLRKKNLKK